MYISFILIYLLSLLYIVILNELYISDDRISDSIPALINNDINSVSINNATSLEEDNYLSCRPSNLLDLYDVCKYFNLCDQITTTPTDKELPKLKDLHLRHRLINPSTGTIYLSIYATISINFNLTTIYLSIYQ
jgi:hypothetical protein